jgi:hypothetical protein
MTTRQAWWIFAFSVFAAVTSSPRRAEARACSVASDCPKGFDCEPYGVAADGGAAGICTSVTCQSNSDCGPGFTCYRSSRGVGVQLGALWVPTVCTQTTADTCSACVPQWAAPCLASADCGPGFTCSPGPTGYDCGKDQDASRPAYENAMIIPCSAVSMPPFLPPSAPPLCEAGSTCTAVSVNQCISPQSSPCRGNSDCPSTWTCGCETNCEGPVLASDGGCVLVCIPSNSDLVVEECNGGGGGPSLGPGGLSSAPSSSGGADSGLAAAGSGGSPGAGGSPGPHGGCQIGFGRAGGEGALVAVGVFAAARRRSRRRGPVPHQEAS